MPANDAPRHPRHPSRRRGQSASATVIGVAMLASTLTPATVPTAAAQASGLETIGTLDTGLAHTDPLGELSILGLATSKRRLYTAFRVGLRKHIAAYDTSTDVPTLLRLSEPDVISTNVITANTAFIDEQRNRALILGLGTGTLPVIEHVDLETLTDVGTWELTEVVPGFAPTGLTHDAPRDRVYLIGEFDGSAAAQDVVGFGGTTQFKQGAAVVALNAATGAVVWVTRLEGCDAPLNSGQSGAAIRLSGDRPLLYVFCMAGKIGFQPTGQGGLMRIDISDGADASGLLDLPTEFFPVSGNFSGDNFKSGNAGFDPVRERFFAHSLSDTTHGAWVFDGLRSSWIGFVAAPDNTNQWIGVDPVTGIHYMGGGDNFEPSGYVNVTDGGATRVPQGRLHDDISVYHRPTDEVTGPIAVVSDMVVDSATRRVFIAYTIPNTANVAGVASYGFAVLRDSTAPITPPTSLELDELTHDLSDSDANLEFSANTSGFGAQHAVVGGWENFYTRVTVPIFAPAQDFVPPNPANIRYGNRGASTAFAGRVGIAQSGSSASAIASQPDDNTPADGENKSRDVTDQLPAGDVDDIDDFAYTTCLDGIGEPVRNEQGSEEEPGHAVVNCDLEKLETTATVRFSGGSGGGGVLVSRSSFDARTYRDPDRGVVAEAVAVADGVSFGEVGLGGMSIERVESRVTTSAKGLDGAANVRWERRVQGARSYDADGTPSEPESCTTIVESGKEVVHEGECGTLEKQLNDLFPNRFEIRFPMPEVVATPGGAFASIQETEMDFLSGQTTNNDQLQMVPGVEITVFNDASQRGRLLTQLAAVKADATFIRSPIYGFEPFGGSTGSADSADDAGTTATQATGGQTTSGGQTTDGGQTTSGVPSYSGDSSVPPAIADGPPVMADVAGVSTDRPEVATDEILGVVVASHEQRVVGAFGWLPALRSLGDALLTGALYLLFLLPIAEIVRRRRLLGVLADVGPGDESSVSVSRSSARAAT
jgi:hypothetical protein